MCRIRSVYRTDNHFFIVRWRPNFGKNRFEDTINKYTLFLQNISELREDKFALIFGNEVNGVKQTIVDRSNYVIEIPQFGTKHSLNVSVCAGIVLWEFCKKYI